jgi:ABC-type glycerol-3-phosphate transport system substrate-binding protein
MLGRRRALLAVFLLVAGACGAASGSEPDDTGQTTTTKVTLDIGEPAVLDRDDPEFTR